MQWQTYYEPSTLSDEQVRGVENELGVEFPDRYRQLVMRCHGAQPVVPEHAEFSIDIDNMKTKTFVGGFLPLVHAESSTLVDVYHTFWDAADHDWPPNVVPFATTGDGDYFCFDYRGDSRRPRVVYFAHEYFDRTGFVRIAETFSEFVGHVLKK